MSQFDERTVSESDVSRDFLVTSQDPVLTRFIAPTGFLRSVVAASRAKQLRRGAVPRLHELRESMFGTVASGAPSSPERIALEEVRRGLVGVGVSGKTLRGAEIVRTRLPFVSERGAVVDEVGIQGSGIVATVDDADGIRLLRALVASTAPRTRTPSKIALGDALMAPTPEQASWIGSVLASQQEFGSGHSRGAEYAVEASQYAILDAALSLLETVWRAEDNPDAYRLALLVPHANDAEAEFTLTHPALMLREGSLIGDLARGAVQLPRAAVALVLVGPTARATNLVERLRKKAFERQPARFLRALDDPAVTGDLQGKTAVVILVHGLLSIDIGLFDGLLAKLDALPTVVAIGFPHDTLAPIHTNAQDLAEAIDQLVASSKLPVVLVCHSRGGLVARDALAMLQLASRPFIRGCVTFGTPHRGATLAESPRKLVAAFAVAAAGKNSGSIASLEDCLAYVLRAATLQGILDLVPAEGGGTFLTGLVDRERTSGYRPELLAIGGIATPSFGLRWLLRENLGDQHDLVVSLTSSMPRRFAGHATASDHFSYFVKTASSAPNHLDVAFDFIRDRLDRRHSLSP